MDNWKNDIFPRDGSSGQGTYRAYSVEARHNYSEPIDIYGTRYDREWRAVPVRSMPPGVGLPSKKHLTSPMMERLRLLSWEQANAIRWCLHCGGDEHGLGSLCLETRIVEHEVEYKYSERVVAAHAPIGGDDFGGTKPPTTPFWGGEDTSVCNTDGEADD